MVSRFPMIQLDSTYVDVSNDKDYQSVDELRQDLLDLPIYFDWVAPRIPKILLDPKIKKYIVAWIQIMITAVSTTLGLFEFERSMRARWGSW